MKPDQSDPDPTTPVASNPPETFDHHVQIHQVGDGVGFAIIQSFQGLQKTARFPEEPGGSGKHSFESVLFAGSVLSVGLLLSASQKYFPPLCKSVPQPELWMKPPAHPMDTTPCDFQSLHCSRAWHSRPGRRGPSRSGQPDGSAASPAEMHPSSSRESPAGMLPWLP